MPRTNGSAANGNRPGRGQNVWTNEQRLCLWFLHQEHSLTRKQRLNAFNKIHQVELASHGLPHGLAATSFSAQYSERLKTGNVTWQAVMRALSSPEETQLRAEIRTKIAAALAANDNGIEAPARSKRPPPPPRTLPPSTRVSHIASSLNKRSADEIVLERPRKVVRTARVVIPPTLESERRAFATPAQSSISRFQYRQNDLEQTPRAGPSSRTPTQAVAKKQARPGATMLYERPGRPSIYLKPNEFAETRGPLVSVIEGLGKPPPPPLNFRYFNERSHGVNEPDQPLGFVCGRFSDAYVTARPAPSCDEVEWNDLARHLDHAPNPSPFISTSNLLIWTIQMALKSAKKGAEKGRISIIDTQKVEQSSVFWVPEFHKSLASKRVFNKGGFIYKGCHEHLVWNQIPGSAVLRTFSLADLFSFQGQDPAVAGMLRLAEVGMKKQDGVSGRDLLKHQALLLTDSNIRAIAKFIDFLGFNQEAHSEHLVYLVYEVVRGWEFKVEKENDKQWQHQAGVFAHYFCRKSEKHVGVAEIVKLETAWLNGVAWSCHDVPNARLKPEVLEKLLRKAKDKGLGDPSSIVMSELGAALNIANSMEEERTHAIESTRALQPLKALQDARRSQVLIEYGTEEHNMDETTAQNQLMTPNTTPSRPRASVRNMRHTQPTTPQTRVKASKAQLLLTDGIDEEDDDYVQPGPSRTRTIVRPVRYEQSFSLPKRNRVPRVRLDFAGALDGNDEDDEYYAEPGPSHRRS